MKPRNVNMSQIPSFHKAFQKTLSKIAIQIEWELLLKCSRTSDASRQKNRIGSKNNLKSHFYCFGCWAVHPKKYYYLGAVCHLCVIHTLIWFHHLCCFGYITSSSIIRHFLSTDAVIIKTRGLLKTTLVFPSNGRHILVVRSVLQGLQSSDTKINVIQFFPSYYFDAIVLSAQHALFDGNVQTAPECINDQQSNFKMNPFIYPWIFIPDQQNRITGPPKNRQNLNKSLAL